MTKSETNNPKLWSIVEFPRAYSIYAGNCHVVDVRKICPLVVDVLNILPLDDPRTKANAKLQRENIELIIHAVNKELLSRANEPKYDT